MPVTANLAIPKPDPDAQVDEEFYRLGEAWDLVDLIVFGVLNSLSGKAAVLHGHTMADIVGLTQALSEKMGIGEVFKLDDLQDVQGAAGAATNYILAKTAQGLWAPSSPAAVLGIHQHAVADIVGLSAAIAAQVNAVVGAAPGALDTLAEIAAALGNNPNFATAMTNSLAAKAPLASPAFTGNPTAPTPAATDNDTTIATTAFVQAVVAALASTKANLASPAFSGNPTAPTQPAGTNSTRLATTAFVAAAIAASVADFLVVTDLFYTGSSVGNVNFPVGSYVLVGDTGAQIDRNALVVPRLQAGNNVYYIVGGSGAALSGIWRCRGYVGSGIALIQRVNS